MILCLFKSFSWKCLCIRDERMKWKIFFFFFLNFIPWANQHVLTNFAQEHHWDKEYDYVLVTLTPFLRLGRLNFLSEIRLSASHLGRFLPNLQANIIGTDKELIRFCDLDPIFKVSMVLWMSNFSFLCTLLIGVFNICSHCHLTRMNAGFFGLCWRWVFWPLPCWIN